MSAERSLLILGGGVSGLATAFYAKKLDPDLRITVLERDDTPGGTAQSRIEDGFTFDLGPNGFLTSVTSTVDLAEELGMADELAPASDAAESRFIYKDGRLEPLPMSPPAFIKTRLLSPLGKLRVALEPLMPRRAPEGETVFEFAERRLGREFAEAFIAPMVIGITSGDARRVSLDALFPRMRALETEHGGLFRGMLAVRKRKGKKTGPSGGRLTTFRNGGVGALTQRLAEAVGDDFRHGAAATSVALDGDALSVALDGDHEDISADAVVVATPAYAAAELLADLDPDLADVLATIVSADVRVFGLVYDPSQIGRSLDGFGFLVPRGEGLRILGCLWTSTLFPSHAKPGMAFLRVITGGVHDPNFFDLDDEDALDIVKRDLGMAMNVRGEPKKVFQAKWKRGIPQYQRDHMATLRTIDQRLTSLPGLFLAGNSYRGVSLNDCIKNAHQTAVEATSFLKNKKT